MRGVSYEEFQELTGMSVRTGTTIDNIKEIFNSSVLPKKTKGIQNELDPSYIKPAWDTTIDNGLIDLFLEDRGFTKDILKAFKVGYCFAGYYSHRLILPILPYGEVLGFTARDLTGTASRKYLFPKGFNAHDYIYTTFEPHTLPSLVFIVEGIFDAWSVVMQGYHAIAIFSKSLSPAQYNKINSLNIKQLFIMLDGDVSLNELRTIKYNLEHFSYTNIIQLPYEYDPCLFLKYNDINNLLALEDTSLKSHI
jgi:DNA primase